MPCYAIGSTIHMGSLTKQPIPSGGIMTTTQEATDFLYRRAHRVPFNIAPERAAELSKDIFGADRWEFRSTEGKANFIAVAHEKTVYLTFTGLASLWCVAYVAYSVMDIGSRARRDGTHAGQPCIDATQAVQDLNLQAYLDHARRLMRGDEPWPADICRPATDPAASTREYLVNNLFFGALSWILLHEIAHVHHKDEGIEPRDILIKQEAKADKFATDWVFGEVGNGLTREYRILAVTVALAWILLFEFERGKSNIHPDAIRRFEAAVAEFNGGERSAALENATYALKAIFDSATQIPGNPTPREAFAWMCERLRVLMPPRN